MRQSRTRRRSGLNKPWLGFTVPSTVKNARRKPPGRVSGRHGQEETGADDSAKAIMELPSRNAVAGAASRPARQALGTTGRSALNDEFHGSDRAANDFSGDSDALILVDEADRELGFLSKDLCHDGQGTLHRAFSLLVFNETGELLL